MNLFTKRLGLVLAGVVGVGAIASLAIGASFALFTSSAPTQNNTFAAGTLALTACGTSTNHPGETTSEDGTNAGTVPSNCAGSATITKTFPGVQPGDTDTSYYALQLDSSSVPAFVEVNLSWSSKAVTSAADGGSGCATTVTDCTAPGSEPFLFADPNTTLSATDEDLSAGSSTGKYQELWYGPGTAAGNPVTTCSATSGYWICSGTVTEVEVYDNQNPTTAASWSADNSHATWTPGDSQSLTLTVHIPSSAGNGIQGVSATISITGSAVQSANNTDTAGPAGCASGTTLGYASQANKPATYSCPSAWS
ncbi:MAG: SipW-dependent-type signal peptide-containing protein [Acidimicrobiales bacterium]